MARPIDEKIVAMKMDISDFKRKAAETTGLFGKLKTSIGNVGETKGFGKIKDSLSGIQSAAQKVDMSSLSSAVDNVAGRFSNLDVIATTALATLTAKAVSAGTQLVKSLGMEQVATGFSEYELKMGSIGTVLSNTEWNGTTLTDVNKTLAELNEYSDQTIYNFAQMTQNVGRFTAAGVTLGDSTTAIKGLGNLAAISGSTSDQLNTAMYQMSQALAAGKLNLMDWNSMTNAGMGGKKTQDALVATAKSMGIAVDMSDGFRNSIEQGWLTSEVFLETLKQFGNDESMTEAATKVRTFSQMIDTTKEGIASGWAETWEIVFGDFEEATNLWTGVSNVIGGFFQSQAEMRNKILGAIFDGGGFGLIFKTIGNILKPIGQILGAIGAGFKAAFPPMGATGILALITGIEKLSQKLAFSDETVAGITKVFQAFFSIFAIGGKVIAGGLSLLVGLLPSFSGLGSAILDLVSRVAGIPIAFNNSISSAEAFAAAIKFLQKVADVVAAALTAVIGALIIFAKVVEQVWHIMAYRDYVNVGLWAEDHYIIGKLFEIRDALAVFVGAVRQIWNVFSKGDYVKNGPWAEDSYIIDKLFDIREAVEEFVGAVIQAWNIFTKGDYVNSGPWAEDSYIIDKLFDLRESIVDLVGGIKDALSSMFDGGGGTGNGGAILTSIFDKIKTGAKFVIDAISNLDFSIEPVIEGFTIFFTDIKEGFGWLKDKLKGAGEWFKNLLPSGETLMQGGFVAAMITIVGFALKFAWDLKQMFMGWGQIGEGVTEVLEGVGGALESFAWQVKAQAILTIAIALVILAAGFYMLAKIGWKDLSKGLYGIVGGLSAIIGAMAIMDKYEIEGGGLKVALTIVGLSIAFAILAGAMKKMAGMKWEEIAKGIVGLAGVMLVFAGAVAIMSKFGSAQVGASALQFIALAVAMHILLSVVKKIAEVSTDDLIKGVSTLGIILLQMALFLKIAGGANFGIGSTIGMLAIGGAIMIIVKAVEMIAGVDTDKLVKGLTVITLILAQVTLFARLTSGAGLLTSSIGLGLVAASLLLLTIPLAILGSMDMQVLAIGLGAIAIALVAIGLASKLMTGLVTAGIGIGLIAASLMLLLIPITAFGSMSWETLIKGMTGLALVLLVLGGAALLLAPAAVPLMLFGVALGLLGGGLALAGLGISLFSTSLVTLAAMTGSSVITIVAMLGTLIAGLVSLIPKAVDFIFKVIHSMADAIGYHAPVLYAKMLDMAVNLLGVIETYVPKFVTAAAGIMIAFLNGMAKEIPRIIEAGSNLITEFITGMETESVAIMLAVASLIITLSEVVTATAPKVLNAFLDMMSEVTRIMIRAGTATIDALFGWIPGVEEITRTIGETAELRIEEAFGAQRVAEDKGDAFIAGLESKKAGAEAAGTNVGSSAEAGADSADLGTIGASHGDDMASSLASRAAASRNAGVKNADSAESGANTANLSTIGNEHGNDFASSLASRASAANTSGRTIANSGKTGAAGVTMSSTGVNFGSGFAGGINSQSVIDRVASAGRAIARAAKNAVTGWLDIRSPSRVAMKDGGFFGEGFALGMLNKTKRVGQVGKTLALTAKDTINEFIDKFELPDGDNEMHFKAVIDYDTVDTSRFGSLRPLTVGPDTSSTNRLISSTAPRFRQNGNNNLETNRSRVAEGEQRSLLSDIKEGISRLKTDQPVYLVINDKVVGQSVSKQVIENTDIKYMKAERGLADA